MLHIYLAIQCFRIDFRKLTHDVSYVSAHCRNLPLRKVLTKFDFVILFCSILFFFQNFFFLTKHLNKKNLYLGTLQVK